MISFLIALAVHTSDIKQVWTNHTEEQVNALEMQATFYTAHCEGCIGITKSGHDVRNTIFVEGLRVIAVDPNIIPLGSIVNVELENGQSFDALASDTGVAIKGNRIDVLVSTTEDALQLGRQDAKITIKENENG